MSDKGVKKWSDSQLEVINSDADRLLVSASAGSGKTTVMIERILRLISGGTSVSNMLICTFTRASAADMRAKLYEKLCTRKLDVKDLARADISTIDSFCQRLVTKYFYVLGVDPQFEVLEESEASVMLNEAIERTIEELTDEDFVEFRRILRSYRSDFMLKKAISTILDAVALNPSEPPTYNYDHGDTARQLSEYVERKKGELLGEIEAVYNATHEPILKNTLLKGLNGEGFGRYAGDFKACYDYLKAKVNKFLELKEKISELRPQSESERYINALLKAAELASVKYAEKKAARAAVDFADLENMALKILSSPALSEIRKKYKYIFVDEYQDINPLQEKIISLIAEGNNLFMVGDLKQSIYAFRGCDPRIFKAKYDAYTKGEGGKVIDLNDNYRSATEVIGFVNKIFGKVMTENYGGVSYKSHPMCAFRGEKGYCRLNLIKKSDNVVENELYSVRRTNSRLSDIEAEATVVVNRVVELLNKEHTAKERKITFKDIAILTRKSNLLFELIIRKLREANIPVSLEERAFYLLRPETGQLIAYLRLLDNRCDDNSLAIAMLSPLGGFDEDELSKIRQSGAGRFYERVFAEAKSNEKVRDFLDTLDKYYELSLTVGVDELADIIVSERGFFNYAFSISDEAAKVLDAFLSFLGGCAYKSSLRACLKFIDERNPYAEIGGDENAVRVMTIHKSKGLEFDYVFVVGLDGSFNLDDLREHISVRGGVFMNVYSDHESHNSDAKFLAGRHDLHELVEEEMRILYVAMTRAREGLELFGVDNLSAGLTEAYEELTSINAGDVMQLNDATSCLKWFLPSFFLANKYDADSVEEIPPRVNSEPLPLADEQTTSELKDYFEFSPPSSAPVKSYVTKIAHLGDEPAQFIFEEKGEHGSIERGNAYHRAMEQIDFNSPDVSCISEGDLALIDVNKILAAAKRMSELSGVMYKEKPFMLRLSGEESGLGGKGDVLVQGVIDLLIIGGDEATIIDYKKGKPHGAYEAGYFKQLDLYALAVTRLLGKKVVSKRLYYFDEDCFVEK